MATTMKDIEGWLERGKEVEATHMLVICDSFSYEDYPVYVTADQDVHKIIEEKCKSDNMQRLMECYSYAHDLEKKLKTRFNKVFD